VYILSESDHLETNLFEVFPLQESSVRFLTQELQDRVKTEVLLCATDVEVLKVNKFTSNLSKLEEIFASRIKKVGFGVEIPNPRKSGKIIYGSRIKLKQVDGFLWHWQNHQPEKLELIDKWKESFQSDLKEAIENHIEDSKKKLKDIETINYKEMEGEKEYLLFSQFIKVFYNGIEKFIKEMLVQNRDSEFVESQLKNLKAYEDYSKEFWINMKIREKNGIDEICLNVLKSFQKESEEDEWADFLGPEGNFITSLLDLDEKIDDDYFSYLINHNLLRNITNLLHGKISILRRLLTEEKTKNKELSENLQTKMEHELNMADLLEQYKQEKEDLKNELSEKKTTFSEQNLKLIELKYQVENLGRQKEGLEKELEFRNKEVQFEIEKKERTLVEKESKIDELMSQLTRREKEFEELKENTLLVTTDMETLAMTGETFLTKDKNNQELTDNIWETYKRTGEIYTNMEEEIKKMNLKMDSISLDLFTDVNKLKEIKGEKILNDIFGEKNKRIKEMEKDMNQKDLDFQSVRNRLDELLSVESNTEENDKNVQLNKKNEEEKRELLEKLNSKERVINTLNSTMKNMLEHISSFSKEKGELNDNLEQYIALIKNLQLLRNKCWKNENEFKVYKDNVRILSKSKREILNYVYKKCKKRGFFG
jgi:hypothetical protein